MVNEQFHLANNKRGATKTKTKTLLSLVPFQVTVKRTYKYFSWQKHRVYILASGLHAKSKHRTKELNNSKYVTEVKSRSVEIKWNSKNIAQEVILVHGYSLFQLYHPPCSYTPPSLDLCQKRCPHWHPQNPPTSIHLQIFSNKHPHSPPPTSIHLQIYTHKHPPTASHPQVFTVQIYTHKPPTNKHAPTNAHPQTSTHEKSSPTNMHTHKHPPINIHLQNS